MLFKSRKSAPTDKAAPSQAFIRIAQEAQALRAPATSLFYACVQERLSAQAAELAALDEAMEQVKTEGFAAAVRLMSLDAPDRVVFNAFTEISGGGAAYTQTSNEGAKP